VGARATDLLDAAGLAIPTLPPEVQERLGAHPFVDVRNPVDVGVDVAPDDLAAAVSLLGTGEAVDAVLVPIVGTRLTDPGALFAAVGSAAAGAAVPVLLVAPGAPFVTARETPAVAVYRTVESATGALFRAMRYAAWRQVPDDRPAVDQGTRGVHARAWARAAVAERRSWLAPAELVELLAPYGIELVGRPVRGAESAASAAAELGFPVVVKVADPTVLHKSDRGLVRVDLRTADQVATAVHDFAEELGADPAALDLVVQPLLLGHQVSIGLDRDPRLGALVRVGGGAGDDVHLLPPVGPADAARAVRALRLWPQVVGDHGPAAVDLEPLEALVGAVGQLAVDVPYVADLTLEPVVLNASGPHCVDVKVRLAEPVELDAGVPRRLRS
jgi:acyl-CoA synthetase (NDP forming)